MQMLERKMARNSSNKEPCCLNFPHQETEPSNTCSRWSIPASLDTLKITFTRILSCFLWFASSSCCVLSFQIKYLQRRARKVAPRRLHVIQKPKYRKPEGIFLIGGPVIWSLIYHRHGRTRQLRKRVWVRQSFWTDQAGGDEITCSILRFL